MSKHKQQDIYKLIKGRKEPSHATRVIPNKKKELNNRAWKYDVYKKYEI